MLNWNEKISQAFTDTDFNSDTIFLHAKCTMTNDVQQIFEQFFDIIY